MYIYIICISYTLHQLVSIARDEWFFPRQWQRSCKEFVRLHSVSQVFKPARTAREKVGNWKSSLKLGYLTRKMIKQWDFGVSPRFSDIPDISDILTYLLTHFVTHILICFLTLFWHFVWTSLTVWHVFCCMAPGIYSDTCADMVSSDMTTRWPHDDSEAFGRKEKYLTYREHPGTQSV